MARRTSDGEDAGEVASRAAGTRSPPGGRAGGDAGSSSDVDSGSNAGSMEGLEPEDPECGPWQTSFHLWCMHSNAQLGRLMHTSQLMSSGLFSGGLLGALRVVALGYQCCAA